MLDMSLTSYNALQKAWRTRMKRDGYPINGGPEDPVENAAGQAVLAGMFKGMAASGTGTFKPGGAN